MHRGDWNEIEPKLKLEIETIFKNVNIKTLTDYEKRKMIFEYLTNNLDYDYKLLEDIINFEVFKKRITREPYLELKSVIDNKKGICNAISQYYKLLLEQVNIFAYCVICDDGTNVKHQLNLVYDKDKDAFSFDDVTSVVVKRGSSSEYFNYDIKKANAMNQGKKPVVEDDEWVILPEEYVNYLVGRGERPNCARITNNTSLENMSGISK